MLNPDFLISLPILQTLIILTITYFINGLIIIPSSQAILIFAGTYISINNLLFLPIFLILIASNFLGNYALYTISYKWGEKAVKKSYQ